MVTLTVYDAAFSPLSLKTVLFEIKIIYTIRNNIFVFTRASTVLKSQRMSWVF